MAVDERLQGSSSSGEQSDLGMFTALREMARRDGSQVQ